MSALSMILAKKAKGTPVPRRAPPTSPEKWPGHGLTEYQFPTEGHIFRTREAATKWTKIIGYTRAHGVSCSVGSGNYPVYPCPNCPGLMRISFPEGNEMAGTVTASLPCTCAEKVVCNNLNEREFSSTEELVGTVLLKISRTEDTIVYAVYKAHVTDPGKKTNGKKYYYTFITKDREYWQLTCAKRVFKLGDETQCAYFVQELGPVTITKRQAIEKLCAVGESIKQDETEKQGGTAVAADNTICCLRCLEEKEDKLVQFCCPTKCVGPIFCRNDFMKFCATRFTKPLAQYFITDFVMTHDEDGVRCPLCRINCTKYKEVGRTTDPVLIHTPFGWIGERAERNKNTYNKTMQIYRFIVLPFIEAYSSAESWYNQAEALQRDFSASMTDLKATLTEDIVEKLAEKHRTRLRNFKDEMKYYREKILEHACWLKIKNSGYGEPEDIPSEVQDQAKEIELGNIPALEPATGYRNYREICAIKQDIQDELSRGGVNYPGLTGETESAPIEIEQGTTENESRNVEGPIEID